MVSQVMCVCIVCLICTTHSCTGDHHSSKEHNGRISSLTADELLDEFFHIYGDGKRGLNKEGFDKILKHLDLRQTGEHLQLNDGQTNDTHHLDCLHREKFDASIRNKSDSFEEYCPALLLRALVGTCSVETMPEGNAFDGPIPYAWVYSILAITLISACGILGIAVIPVMQKRFYQPLLQFLVALAVGTLAGDALLHLLPHSMTSHHEHEDHESHDQNMYKGVVAMFGLILFFCMERLIMLISKWRKKKQLKDKLPTRLKVIKPETSTKLTNAADKQCIHKYSSFPYCYDEIKMELESQMDDKEGLHSHHHPQHAASEAVKSLINHHHQHHPKAGNIFDDEKENHANDTKITNGSCPELNNMLGSGTHHTPHGAHEDADSIEYTVILREHENPHHGHSHTHGHVHAPPSSITSVAWMVIMGDGLHNFTDGMAIGAAFANSTAGGFSTTVAVFCHELPHELGDFAMLLKAGMTMKQALYYNMLSSILCLLGNLFGLWLGNTEAASSWIFAAAAGMFLYIALVDMIPELSSGHASEDNLIQGVLHLVGLLLGFGIMALIAIFEHDIKSIFNEPR